MEMKPACIYELAASVMRHSLIIIIIFVGQVSHAQWRQDTTISKKMLDSLYHELIRYKDAAKQTYFNQIVNTNTIRVDSTFSGDRDTLIVTNFSKSKKTLRRQEILFDRTGCKRWLIDTYFDTTGRKEYEEQWHMGCNLGNNVTGILTNRTKYHYDNSGGQMGMTQEFWDGGGHRVRKYNYSIDIDGKKIWGKSFTLHEYAFWD